MSPHQALVCVILAVMATIHTSSTMSTEGFNELREALQQQLADYAAHLEHSAAQTFGRYQRSRENTGTHQRSIRSNHGGDTRHSFVAGTGVGNREVLQLDAMDAVSGTILNAKVSDWKFLSLPNGNEYLVTIQPTNSRVEIFQVNVTLGNPLNSVFQYSVDAVTIETFHVSKTARAGLRFIEQSFIAVASATQVVLLNSTFDEVQTLDVADVKDIEAFQINSLNYLVLATETSPSSLYMWSSTLGTFEFDQRLLTGDDRSVTSFTIGGNAYLAFAGIHNKTFVYRYDSNRYVFKSYQILDCVGATYVTYFTAAYTHFLAVIIPDFNTTVIFKWQLRTFYEFQRLSTPNANSLVELSPSNCQDSTFLLLTSDAASPDALKLYRYSAVPDEIEEMDTGDELNVDGAVLGASGATSFATATGNGSFYLAVGFDMSDPSTNAQASIMRMTTSVAPVEDPYVEEIGSLQDEIGNLTNSLHVYEMGVNTTKMRVDDAVTLDGNDTITGNKNFIGPIAINGDATIAVIDVEGNATVPIAPGEDENLNLLEEKLNNQTTLLTSIDSLFDNSVTLETNQTITGAKTFTKVTVEGTLTTQDLTAEYINGYDIEQLSSDAVRLDQTQTISGNINFTNTVNITADLDVSGDINGLDLQTDVVLTDVVQTITGTKEIDNSVTIEDNMLMTSSSELNGLDVSSEVVTLSGDYSLAGHITFQDVVNITSSITITGDVDGVDVSDLSADAMTRAGTQTIVGNLTIQSLATFNTNVTVTGTVNDEDLSDIDSRALKLTQDAQVTGQKIFNGPIFMDGDLLVDEEVDELDWPSDIMTKSGNNVVTGYKTFTGEVNVTYAITVGGTVDGLDLSEEVVTLAGTHSITGEKNFSSGIHVDGDIIVDGTVDGVDVTQLNATVMTLSTDQTIAGELTFADDVHVQGSIAVTGSVNGQSLFNFKQDTVFKDFEADQTITGAKTFEKQVTILSGLTKMLGTVNGYQMDTAFLDTFSDQTITGQKTFADGLTVQNNATVSCLIQGVDLEDLHDEAVLTWRGATISGEKTFANGIDVEGNLITANLVEIEGFDVSEDFMMINREQNITGFMWFNDIEIEENLSVDDVDISETLNTRNWTHFVDNRITLSTNQTLQGLYTVSDSSTVTGNITVDGTVNTFNLTELADNILYKSEEQTITGELTFTGTVSVTGDILCDGFVDGVNITDINDRAIFIGQTQTIERYKTFTENVIVNGNIVLRGELNNVTLSDVFTDGVYDNAGVQYITAQKTFSNGFIANEDVTVADYVNGIDLSAQMLTKSDAQTVTGTYTFGQDVTVNDDFDLDGDVNGIDIEVLNSTVMKTNVAQTIDSVLTFSQDLHVDDDDIHIVGFVDGVNVTDLKLNAVMLDEVVDIDGDLYFSAPVTFRDDIHVSGLVHGLDFAAWVDEIVTIDTPQTIPYLRTFTGDITAANGIQVSGNILAETAFDKDLDAFITDAVLLDLSANQTITGFKTFSGSVQAWNNITITGNVNGVKVATDVVTLDGTQNIGGVKTFTANITVEDDIVISGMVNDVDISVSEADTFLTNDPEELQSKKTFRQTLTVREDISVGHLVDGIDLDQEAVTLDTDQEISGVKTFLNTTIIRGSVDLTGSICDVNISVLNETRVSLSINETINSELVFDGHATFEQDVTIIGGLNDIDLYTLQMAQNEITSDTKAATNELACVADYRCMTIDGFQYLYYDVYSEMTHLSAVQSFSVHAESFEHFTIDGVPYLAMARTHDVNLDECIDSIVYRWNATLEEYQEQERLATRKGRRWHSFTIDDTVYLAIANLRDMLCDGDDEIANTIYKYNGANFEYFQNLADGGSNDIDTFSIDGDMYLAVANAYTSTSSGNSTVYKYDSQDDQFVAIQSMEIGDATGVEFLKVAGVGVFLAFSASDLDYASIFLFDDLSQQFTLHYTLPSVTAATITAFEYQHCPGLIIANHVHTDINNVAPEGNLAVYIWNDDSCEFEISSTIPIVSAADVKAFVTGGNLHVAAIGQNTNLQLFKYGGFISFAKFQTQELNGVTSVEVYEMGNDIQFAVGVNPADTSLPVYPIVLNGNVIGDTLPDVIDDLCVNTWYEAVFHDPEEMEDDDMFP